jgi:hypothetical protein
MGTTMTPAPNVSRPYEKLAVAYAGGHLRAALALLLELDGRLFSVATKGQEPLLAQMRVVWWRDQFEKLPSTRPRGEPLLQKLEVIEDAAPTLNIGARAVQLANAWEILAGVSDIPEDAEFERHLNLRAAAIFGAYAQWDSAPDSINANILTAGRYWAASTVGMVHHSFNVKRVGIKPLDILVRGARLDLECSVAKRAAGAMRLGILALTGL